MRFYFIYLSRVQLLGGTLALLQKKGEFQLQFQLQAIIGDDMICLTITLKEQHRSKTIQ